MVGSEKRLATPTWQMAPMELGIRLCSGGNMHGLASKLHFNIRLSMTGRKQWLGTVGRKQWLAPSTWHMATMVMASRKLGLASQMHLDIRLCMVGSEKRLATPTWQMAPMELGIRLCSGGNMHGLASKVHFNIRLSMTGRKQWLASKLHLTLRLCMTGKLHGGLASHLWLVTTMGTVGRKE